MIDLIAVDNISIMAGQNYGAGGKEITATEIVIIKPGEAFSLPEERAAILIERGAVKREKSNQKSAKGAG